jgi:hypothetical protein
MYRTQVLEKYETIIMSNTYYPSVLWPSGLLNVREGKLKNSDAKLNSLTHHTAQDMYNIFSDSAMEFINRANNVSYK